MTALHTTHNPWLAAFHAGERGAIERCYREHFEVVAAAARRVLPPVDAETVCHEVFHGLLSSAEMRASFLGGDLAAWLSRVATNRAIDWKRRAARESLTADVTTQSAGDAPRSLHDEMDARRLVERFLRERLPEKFHALFEARFMKDLSQREAAQLLGIERSTLAYQEQQVRTLLRRFVLEEEP
jgi:RNA polymerase sigma-70 factor, ECF subfamily